MLFTITSCKLSPLYHAGIESKEWMLVVQVPYCCKWTNHLNTHSQTGLRNCPLVWLVSNWLAGHFPITSERRLLRETKSQNKMSPIDTASKNLHTSVSCSIQSQINFSFDWRFFASSQTQSNLRLIFNLPIVQFLLGKTQKCFLPLEAWREAVREPAAEDAELLPFFKATTSTAL